jgi:hypothetical protein
MKKLDRIEFSEAVIVTTHPSKPLKKSCIVNSYALNGYISVGGGQGGSYKRLMHKQLSNSASEWWHNTMGSTSGDSIVDPPRGWRPLVADGSKSEMLLPFNVDKLNQYGATDYASGESGTRITFQPGSLPGVPAVPPKTMTMLFEMIMDHRYELLSTGERILVERGFLTGGGTFSRVSQDWFTVDKEYCPPEDKNFPPRILDNSDSARIKELMYVCRQKQTMGLPISERYLVRRQSVRPWYLRRNYLGDRYPFVLKKKYDEYEVFYKYQ